MKVQEKIKEEEKEFQAPFIKGINENIRPSSQDSNGETSASSRSENNSKSLEDMIWEDNPSSSLVQALGAYCI